MKIADYVNETTPSTATVLFWGRPTHVYNLTKRRSPFFAAGHALLFAPGPSFSRFDKWYDDIETIMREDPPEVVLLERSPEGGYVELPEPGHEGRISDIVFNHLPNYRKEISFDNVDLYRLN
jgi:hypothetical protein